jgi:hypothetical protein
MFKRVLKNLLLLAFFVLLAWFAVITYWETTHRVPDESDIVLYLVLLPLILLLAAWLLKKFLNGLQQRLASRLKVGAPGSAAGTADALAHNKNPSAQEQSFTLELIATALQLPQANSAAALLDRLEEPVFEPKPSVSLRTHAGTPVLCTEVPDLPVEAIRHELSVLTTEDKPTHEFGDSQVRCAALIQPVLETLVKAAQQKLDASQASAPTPHLRVHLLLPAAWHALQRQQIQDWLKKSVLSKRWPESSLRLSHQACDGKLECIAILDDWNSSLNRESLDDLCLLIAADSALDPDFIGYWEQQGQLFTATQRKGRIPGEGAAGVLVKRGYSQKTETLDSTPIYLHRSAMSQHDQSINNNGGSAGALLLQKLAQQALQLAGSQITDITKMIADTDHRADRLMEVVQASMALAKTKPDDDLACYSSGQSMGYAGAAATLAALSACREYCAKEKKPVLWCSAQDDSARAAAVIRSMNF